MTIDMAFGALLPDSAADRTLIAAELRGHGRTADMIATSTRVTWRATSLGCSGAVYSQVDGEANEYQAQG